MGCGVLCVVSVNYGVDPHEAGLAYEANFHGVTFDGGNSGRFVLKVDNDDVMDDVREELQADDKVKSYQCHYEK